MFCHHYRNAEDVKRDDAELHSASQHVLTLDGEVLALNGKVLGGHSNAIADETDQVSVCSCNCLGPSKCQSHFLSLEQPLYISHCGKRFSV